MIVLQDTFRKVTEEFLQSFFSQFPEIADGLAVTQIVKLNTGLWLDFFTSYTNKSI